MNLTINSEFLTRVEGHGHIVVDVADGVVEKAELQIVEAPRLFEAMLVGRSVFEAQHITSRICGICSCGHSIASLQAGEEAIGLTISKQTEDLRRLLLHMETLDSHILHIFLLVAPDLFGVKSFKGMMDKEPEIVRQVFQMKKSCNDICAIIAGRHVHPVTCSIGGFTKLPKPDELEAIAALLTSLEADLNSLIDLVAGFKLPHFTRETEHVALVDESAYPLWGEMVGSTDGVQKQKREYLSITNEYQVPHSTAKHAKLSRDSYAVGALSRFNLNHPHLQPKAKDVAKRLGLSASCYNPFYNTFAQMVECFQSLAESQQIVESFLVKGVDQHELVAGGNNEQGLIPVSAGSGVGAVEVPRGILFHHYQVDERGKIEVANCVIPTGQNLHNIEEDICHLVPELLERGAGKDEIRLQLEMLVRAYDPCISCSTHLMRIEFRG